MDIVIRNEPGVTGCPTEKIEIRLLLFSVRELTVASRQSKECGSEWRPTDVGTR